ESDLMKMYLRNRQKGAAIFIALIMLLVMTIIGITASQQTTLEEKMAGNLRDQTLALQAGEAVLRWTETWVGDQVGEPVPATSCSPPCDDTVWVLNTLNLTSAPVWSTASVRSNYTGLPTGPGMVTANPKSVVEEHSFIKDSLNQGKQNDISGQMFYRLTANGTGGTTSAQALLQSTYSRRY
ncbi:MAG: pilus assembly PilX family protein, partial [Gammaproteobacteria bacterium]